MRRRGSKRYNQRTMTQHRRTQLNKARNARKATNGAVHVTSDVNSLMIAPSKGRQTIALAMTTAGRGETAPVKRAVRSVRKAGFTQDIHMFAEPEALSDEDFVTLDKNLSVHRNISTMGCFGNWKTTAAWMAENTTEDWIMIMQDDLMWGPSAAATMQHAVDVFDPATTGVLSPYTSPAMVPDRARKLRGCWVRSIKRNYWGALAFCFPRQSLEYLLGSPVFTSHRSSRQVDVVVGRVYYESSDKRWPIIHLPSIGQHIGAVSTIGRDKNPASRWGRCGFGFNLEYRAGNIPV